MHLRGTGPDEPRHDIVPGLAPAQHAGGFLPPIVGLVLCDPLTPSPSEWCGHYRSGYGE